MKTYIASRSLFPLVAAFTLAACSTSAPTPAAAERDIHIEFAAQVGNTPARCAQPLAGLGNKQASAELRDLRFYVSQVTLIDARGAEVPLQLTSSNWQNGTVALIDLADGAGACNPTSPATNTRVQGRAPAGDYRGVRFTVGVPHALNHSDYAVATAPLDVQGMAWSWQAGRKFLQVEVNPAGGVVRSGNAAPGRSFMVHLGAAGCKGNPVSGETVACDRPNRMEVRLDSFNPTSQRVVLDLAALYAGSNIQRDGGGALGCMSAPTDPECAPIFSALGIDQASGQSVAGGSRQTVFRAAPL